MEGEVIIFSKCFDEATKLVLLLVVVVQFGNNKSLIWEYFLALYVKTRNYCKKMIKKKKKLKKNPPTQWPSSDQF